MFGEDADEAVDQEVARLVTAGFNVSDVAVAATHQRRQVAGSEPGPLAE